METFRFTGLKMEQLKVFTVLVLQTNVLVGLFVPHNIHMFLSLTRQWDRSLIFYLMWTFFRACGLFFLITGTF